MAGDLTRNDGILKIRKSLQPQCTKILGTPFIPPRGDEETNVQMQVSQGTLCQDLDTDFICLCECLCSASFQKGFKASILFYLIQFLQQIHETDIITPIFK